MFLFRTETSPSLGTHRLNRCLILGSLLKQYGPVRFLINGDKIGKGLLRDKGFAFIPAFKGEKEKLQQLRCVIFDINQSNPDDISLLNWAKSQGIATVQLGEISTDWMDVEHIINASLSSECNSSNHKSELQGPAYSLLHHKFRHFFKVKRKYAKNPCRILISIGGAPPYRLLRKVIDPLFRHQFQVKVAPGFYFKRSYRKVLKRLYPKLRFVGKSESLARSFYEADVTCITAGQTVFEAASTGTPALYLYKDENQALYARQAADLGLGIVVGLLSSSEVTNIPSKIASLNQEERQTMGMRGKELVDGKGALRIVDFFENLGIMN